MLPLLADEIAVSMMKREFLMRGSWRWYCISAFVFGIAIFMQAPLVSDFAKAQISKSYATKPLTRCRHFPELK